jgi:broad specificity phosphatase PhoE
MTFSEPERIVPVLIVRHAPSTWNDEGRWQGRADPPLSSAGTTMATAAARRVGQVDLVVTSDLMRAVQTGRLLVPGAEEVVVPALGEYDVGEWSGMNRDEIAHRWPAEMAAFEAGRLEAPPGGEDRRSFDRRVLAAVDLVVNLIHSYQPESVLIVTHAGVVRSLGRQLGAEDRHIGHLCGFESRAEEGGLALGSRVCLLDPAEPPEPPVEPQAL